MNAEMARLLKEIAAEARSTAAHTGIAAFSPRVMAALGAVPRQAFVPEDWDLDTMQPLKPLVRREPLR